MNKYISAVIVVIIVILGVWFFTQNKNQPASPASGEGTIINSPPKADQPLAENNQKDKIMNATLRTSEGDITIQFFDTNAPNTVANFTKLAQEGFYNGTKFHRVIKGFMIQGGDPLSKDNSKMAFWGTGGPGYQFADEIDPKSDLYAKGGYSKGIVAMANSGPNTNGSQFFIMAEDYLLPPLYTIFGKVVSGQDVVTKIENTPTGASDRPVTAVVIENISVK